MRAAMLSLQTSLQLPHAPVFAGCINARCLLFVLALGIVPQASAEPLIFELEIRDHLFYPNQLAIPSGVKVKLRVNNTDPTPEEFESYELNREKVIMGGRKATLFIGPLKPGEYPFFGEFNPHTAQGKIIAE